MEVFKKYQNITEITRSVVVELIDQIKIYENKGVEVVFRYGDECKKILESFSDEIKSQMAV